MCDAAAALMKYAPTVMHICNMASSSRTVNFARQSFAGLTGSDSIFNSPRFARSVCVSSTVQITSVAGSMNHIIPIKPCMKKLSSGDMRMPRVSKLMSAFTMLGIHIMTIGASRIQKIFERRSFKSSAPSSVKKFTQTASLLSDI